MIKKYYCLDTREIIYGEGEILNRDYVCYKLSEAQCKKAGIDLIDRSIKTTSTNLRQYPYSQPIQRLNYSWLLKELGVLSVPYDHYGVEWSIIDYLDKHIKNNRQVCYLSSAGEAIDTTDRSLRQIIKEGYKGNRLDIMVNDYYIYVYTKDKDRSYKSLIGQRSGGGLYVANTIQHYNFDSVLSMFTDKQSIIDIAMRAER